MIIKKHISIMLSKLLAFFTIWGCCGGLYIALSDRLTEGKSIILAVIQFSVVLIMGISFGVITKATYKTEKNILLKKNHHGNFEFFSQRIFLTFVFITIAGWFYYQGYDIRPRLVLAAMPSIIYLIGLSMGIYSQFGPSAGRMLLAGMIPLSGSVIFLLIKTPSVINTIIWCLGFIFLICSFLIMNNIQLITNVFMAQEININSTRKIRGHNYVLAVVLSVVCAAFIMLSRILSFIKNVINSFVKSIYNLLEEFSKLITYDLWYRGVGDPQRDVPPEWTTSDISYYAVKIILAVAVVILVVSIIIFVFRIVKRRIHRKLIERKISKNSEYIEESEILRVKKSMKRKTRFIYTKSGLKKITDASDRIRYLYAFILERLYRKQISVKPSHTPSEIRKLILGSEGGEGFANIGFNEFTEKYKKVRYGNKSVDIKTDPMILAEKYEKAIEGIEPP